MAISGGFELQNVGAGPETISIQSLAAEYDFVLLLFQRDHYCTNCRDQVQTVADRYTEFQQRNTAVVSIVPEPPEMLSQWQSKYDLPFPLCADPDAEFSDQYDQPVRFGLLGRVSDFFGRMPKAVVLDCRDGAATIAYSHEGTSTWDRPAVEDLLGVLDEAVTTDPDDN